ncbi:hypothetical protein [Pseudomonas sp. Marseille-Q1929]|uniref:hypothetical protein n=1 Tax=Pseudomonas sp. Marseille-Q1929 TaxID=2730402 RepID=UPI001A8EC945|nr:hypothetical protein [Pseudomonas sp. Marseille-Q1929]MBO0491832.1 hypothetical protein [Pseudomonas sp. Marseille-Q1929]
MNTSRIRLAEFKVQTVQGQVSTNELYANGRHQCEVYIVVAKEVEDPFGGIKRITPLTATEKASVTLVEYSTNIGATLPAGWTCDTVKNAYDCGLRKHFRDGVLEESSTVEAHVPRASVAPIEVLKRYLRLNEAQPLQTRRFMARITVGGKIYTTNFSGDDSLFNSYVEIVPQLPYRLSVRELGAYRDIFAYEDKTIPLSIHVYYWHPPAGLVMLESLGLTAPLNVENEGANFHTSFYGFLGYFRGGVPIGKNTPEASLQMSDVQRNLYFDKNPAIEFTLLPTVMRAVVVEWLDLYKYGQSQGYWRLIDNLGCMHQFRIVEGDNHTLPLKLTD